MNLDLEKDKIQLEKDGKTVDCDILFTFDCEQNKKSYVGYSDNSYTNGRKNIYVSSYNPLSVELELEDITDNREQNMINEVLMTLDQEN